MTRYKVVELDEVRRLEKYLYELGVFMQSFPKASKTYLKLFNEHIAIQSKLNTATNCILHNTINYY